jgi:P-type Ca2+ transporter type 2C
MPAASDHQPPDRNQPVGSGLSAAEAAARLQRDGPNALPQAARRRTGRIILEVLREPMLALLIGGGVVYLILGSLAESLILLAFACLSVVITVVQEARTERVLEALRDLSSPRALVLRDGQRLRIAGRDVVQGDLIILSEGDRVPADAWLHRADDLQLDESLLTGEAVPVRKRAEPDRAPEAQRPGGDDLPMVFSGALVVRGTGIAEVTATGPRSEIGRIGQSLTMVETVVPHLQIQLRRLVISFAVVGAAVSILVVLLSGFLRGSWLDALLSGIAVGMSMLPEEFPVVLAVFMAMGARRISLVRVLTRRAAAIESLGSASVLCTDKTGTLTENRMTIAALRLADGQECRIEGTGGALSAGFADLIRRGVQASSPQPFDPMEKAFHALMPDGVPGALIKTYALRPDCLAMSQVWSNSGTPDTLTIAAKGAPEAIADLCRLDAEPRRILMQAVGDLAAGGLRVLAVAGTSVPAGALPETQQGFHLTLLGLVGLADPLRPSVPAAIAECRSAGIRVVMITGDYPATAQAIARSAGLDRTGIMTGSELAAMSDPDLSDRVQTVGIYARIMPEQKLRIVEALKAGGAVVAMTGDGVNDAPSLKAANIGIAMGGRGTDVAREAAAIVLLDDDFGSIVTTIRLGRRIYDNLRKAMAFILAVHVPIAGLALLPLLFGLPVLFGPMHIAFLEMVIDPVCSLVFEAETEEADVMRRRPRDPAEPLFSVGMVAWSLLQGFLAFATVAGIFVVSLNQGMADAEVRALTFFSLVVVIVALIFVNRSASASMVQAFRRPNRALAIVLPVVAVMLATTLLVPFVQNLFRFGSLTATDLVIPVVAGLGILLLLELLKPLWRVAFEGRSVPVRP